MLALPWAHGFWGAGEALDRIHMWLFNESNQGQETPSGIFSCLHAFPSCLWRSSVSCLFPEHEGYGVTVPVGHGQCCSPFAISFTGHALQSRNVNMKSLKLPLRHLLFMGVAHAEAQHFLL